MRKQIDLQQRRRCLIAVAPWLYLQQLLHGLHPGNPHPAAQPWSCDRDVAASNKPELVKIGMFLNKSYISLCYLKTKNPRNSSFCSCPVVASEKRQKDSLEELNFLNRFPLELARITRNVQHIKTPDFFAQQVSRKIPQDLLSGKACRIRIHLPR